MKRFVCAALAALLLFGLAALSRPALRASAESSDETAQTEKKIRYATKDINLFAKKSASSKKICAIAKGEEMTLLRVSGNWANVIYADAAGAENEGYVKKAYLSKTRPAAEPSPTPAPSPEPSPSPNPDATPTPAPSGGPVRPGGGRPGGGSGGSGGSSATPSPMDLLGITPGKAAVSGHKSGSYSALPYGAVALKLSAKEMESLAMGGAELDISLSCPRGPLRFFASLTKTEGAIRLLLLPAGDEEALNWRLGGSALRTLAESGVTELALGMENGAAVCLMTGNELFAGVVYDRLRASGIPASHFDTEIMLSDGACAVRAQALGESYQVSATPDGAFYAVGLRAVALDDLTEASPDEKG